MIQKRCKYCNKEIDGYNENQVNQLLNQHLVTIHNDILKIVEKTKKELKDEHIKLS